MNDWPNTIPPDLRNRLASVLSQRGVGPAEIWGELRDWLHSHDVAAPDNLPKEPPSPLARHD